MTAVATFKDVCLDANNPETAGGFWGAVLGRQVADAGPGDVTTRDVVLRENPDSPGPTIRVNGLPEPKAGKVSLHLHVDLRDGRSVEDLLALGATVVTEPGTRPWWVRTDPERLKFCAFPPEPEATNDEDAEVPA